MVKIAVCLEWSMPKMLLFVNYTHVIIIIIPRGCATQPNITKLGVSRDPTPIFVTRLIWKLPFRTHCNLLHTIDNCYPIEFILEKRCIKFLHSCLSSDNLVISNVAKSSCDNCYSTFGDNVRYFSNKYNIASKKWMEPFTDLLPCLFDHMHRSNPDLPVAHTIRELALCRDDNSTFLLTSVEMSQIIEYLCTI